MDDKEYTLCVGDTVSIPHLEANLILTNPAEKVFKKIAFYIDENSKGCELKNGFMRLRRYENTNAK